MTTICFPFNVLIMLCCHQPNFKVFGPVLVVQPFRTAKEAISLANNTLYGLGASVWSEHIGLAMEVACNIKAGSVWINNHNVFDAATGFGGFKESGYGRDGGKEVTSLFYSV